MSTPSIQSTPTSLTGEQEDGNPFVGLRPYEAEESYLFFGRGNQTNELLQKLYTTRFIGVVGSSGCGKSSLIKAGLIPKLKAGFLTNDRDHWITASMRPSGNPLLFLSESLCAALGSSQFVPDEYHLNTDYSASFLKAVHEKGVQGIIDILLPVFEKAPCNLLLLVDQFEELFTTKRNDADAETQMNENVIFVNILLSLARQTNLPVYVVITMRSDYIGNCNKFYGLPETLNDGQYLVPRLNRQQLNQVIELPIKLNEEKISARLLDQILNDSDKDLDQLPVLQHALMRTYKFWRDNNKAGDIDLTHYNEAAKPGKETSVHAKTIDFAHYNAAGKLDKALSNHANEVYNGLDDTQKKIAELIFRSLTDVNAENVPIRRRQSLAQLTAICKSVKNSTVQQVEEVINRFRHRDCAFLTPYTGKLKESTIIDISHESLMRQWDKLKKWMNDEQSSGLKFKWLTESVNNQREYLRGIDLSDALNWKQKQPANEQWASRYQGNYKVVEDYIETSRKKATIRRYRRNTIAVVLIIAPVVLYALYQHIDKKSLEEKNAITKQYQDSLERNNGILRTSLIQLDSSLISQKQLKADLEISFKKQQEMAALKAKSDLNTIFLIAENERKERKEKIRVQEEKNREEIEFLKTRLKQESFYNALYNENQSLEYGDAVVNALIDTYGKDKKEYNKFYQAITQVFRAKEIAPEDPITALRISKKARELSKNPVIDSNIKKVIANNIYYKQQIVPSAENEFQAPSLIISNDKTTFAVNNVFNKLYTGRLNNDSLLIDEAFSYSYNNSFGTEDTFDISNASVKTFSIKDDNIFGLEADGTLLRWSNGKRTRLGKIPGVNKYTMAEFSPDQRHLLTAGETKSEIAPVKDSAVMLWNISAIKQNSIPEGTILARDNSFVRQMTFSPNGRQCFIIDGDSLKIYSIGKKEPVFVTDEILAARYSEKGDYIFIISSLGLGVLDSVGGSTNFNAARLDNKYLNDLKSFSLSPDWKKILFKQTGKLFILEREGGDSVFSTNYYSSSQGLKLNSKYFTPDNNLVNTASFVSNNSILSVNNSGNVYLWKTYPEFQNVDDALKSIKLPELTIAEKLEEGSISFEDIQANGNEYNLREAAAYFETKSYDFESYNGKNQGIFLNRASLLYKKLLANASGNKKLYYLDKITSLNKIFKDSRSPDANEQMIMVNRLSENVKLLEEQRVINPENVVLRKKLSTDYNDLSFHLLFVKQYEKSIQCCKKGLELDSANDIIYTNMALALLLSGEFSRAQKIYDQYKDKWYQSGSKSFKDGFLQDFGDLELAGVITPNETSIYNKVEEIKKMLENQTPGKNTNRPLIKSRLKK